MSRILLLLSLVNLIACGKPSDGGSQTPALVSQPSITQPVIADSSPFAGRQWSVTDAALGGVRYCTPNAPGTAPAWNCFSMSKPANCNGLTLPTFIKIHSDNSIDAWGSGFEDAIYNNGQYQLTASGFAWQAAWVWSNGLDPWNTNIAQYGVVMTFAGGCHVYFVDEGAI